MQNKFFQIALNKASKLLGKHSRLILLLTQLARKIRQVNWKTMDRSVVKEKFFILGRLTKAYAQGRYKSIPWKSMVSVVAAILYFISPFDLISDFIPVIGLSDDVGVLLWVYNSLAGEIDKFTTWEKSMKLESAVS